MSGGITADDADGRGFPEGNSGVPASSASASSASSASSAVKRGGVPAESVELLGLTREKAEALKRLLMQGLTDAEEEREIAEREVEGVVATPEELARIGELRLTAQLCTELLARLTQVPDTDPRGRGMHGREPRWTACGGNSSRAGPEED